MYVLLLATLGSMTWFDSEPLYKNPLAHPRSPESGLVFVLDSHISGIQTQYMEGIIGKSIVVVDSNNGLQLGLEASTWALLAPDGEAFPLIMQDFYFSVPLYFKKNNVTGALKFNHISAHQGDGAPKLFKEHLGKEEREAIETAEDEYGVSINPIKPKSYSRDFISLDLAYKFYAGRVYGKAGYAHKIIPEGTKPWFGGAGVELFLGEFYGAWEAMYYQDTEAIGLAQQAGLFLSDPGALYETRAAVMWYMGSDRHGQLMGEGLEYFALGFFLR